MSGTPSAHVLPGDGDPGDGLHVRGGVGGTVAVLEDLVTAAALLARAGEELTATSLAATRSVLAPEVTSTALVSPLSYARAQGDTAVALLGPSGTVALAARLGWLGHGVQRAVAAYRGADAWSEALLREVDLAVGAALGRVFGPAALVGLAAAVAATGTGPLSRWGPAVGSARAGGSLAERLVAASPGVLGGMLDGMGAGPWTPAPRGNGPARTVRRSARLLMAVGRRTPWLHEPPAVLSRVTAGPTATRPPVGVADLAARVAGVSPAAAGDPAGTATPPGTVRVDRVTGPDGRRSWVVQVPGTQVWSPVAGPDPLDLTGAVGALAGERTAAARTVEQALWRAGVRPGEPVLLVGHSQGGMVAAALAADPAFRRGVHVTHVLALGAPVATAGIPPGVQVLSVEHVDDPVPRLDGAPAPQTSSWVTVSAPAPAVPGGQGPHAAHAYVGTALLVDASGDPSVVAWRRGLAPFLDRPGATALALEVTGERLPVAQEPPAPGQAPAPATAASTANAVARSRPW